MLGDRRERRGVVIGKGPRSLRPALVVGLSILFLEACRTRESVEVQVRNNSNAAHSVTVIGMDLLQKKAPYLFTRQCNLEAGETCRFTAQPHMPFRLVLTWPEVKCRPWAESEWVYPSSDCVASAVIGIDGHVRFHLLPPNLALQRTRQLTRQSEHSGLTLEGGADGQTNRTC